MYLTEYQRISVDNFMGLWDRGSLDDVPPDHASDIRNMSFARKREVVTRQGTGFSHGMPNGGNVVRMFDAAFDNNTLIPIACDGIQTIWRLDNYEPLLTLAGLIDFSAINMGNHVYIAPMVDPALATAQPIIYVWANPSAVPRPAAGMPPMIPLTATPGGSTYNIAAGWHGFAYSFIYDTGYVSAPSQVQTQSTANFDGTQQVTLSGIQVPPPPGVVAFLIFATQSQATQQDAMTAALYEVETDNDISSSTRVVNFFDTDLTILASADPANGNLLNTMPFLPGGFGLGSVALQKYHGRMVIIGPFISYAASSYTDPRTGNQVNTGDYSINQNDLVWFSHPGAQENFDTVTGSVSVQAEFDGNNPRTGFELFGVFYICKAVGTFSLTDTGFDPSDPTNPWILNLIDGGIGAYHHAVGTITGSQPSLSFNSTAFLANRNGLFIFNGNVLRPELTWKIRHLWEMMTRDIEHRIRVTVDIYNDVFYVMIPTDDPRFNPNPGSDHLQNYQQIQTSPVMILLGDYSLGLDSNSIRWSILQFPWPVYDIVMAAWPDPVHPPPDFYYLRLGSNMGTIYSLNNATTADEVWSFGQYVRSVPIDNWYQSAPLAIGDLGSLNICRFVRYRMAGQGTLISKLQDQGTPVTPITDTGNRHYIEQMVNVSPDPFPGNYRDIGIQTNFTNEKVIVKFEMNGFSDFLRMARFDVFGKRRWPTRPNG